MEINDFAGSGKTNPIQSQFKAKQTQSQKGQNEAKFCQNKGLWK
ncbi:unnamed protein product [marine sediment metagenome]|uniref:Uncharacterized protein n=1 Tax=marine sediment metagenome TaxID=412755 RepID=X0XVY0_9ZZZZ